VGSNFSRVRLFSSLLSQNLLLGTIQQPVNCASVIGLKRSEREDYLHPSTADVTNPLSSG
jgi:hypothetical protein